MQPLSKNARTAGFLYLLLVLVAPIRLIYIPNSLFVSGDAAATVSNIAANQSLFRLGIVTDLFCATLEIFLALALYRLFRHVNSKHAILMVVLGLMPVPLYLFNVLNDAAALMLIQGPDVLQGLTRVQRDSLAMLFLRLHTTQIHVLEIFWSAWLFPLAALVIRSRFVPRFIGWWLVANGVAYFALSLTGLVFTNAAEVVVGIAFPAQLGEVVFTLWLLVAGARPRQPARLDDATVVNAA